MNEPRSNHHDAAPESLLDRAGGDRAGPRAPSALLLALVGALFGVVFAIGVAVGVRADEHEIPATLGVFGPGGLHSAVYPRQDIPLRFSHAQHLGKGIRCDRCHGDLTRSDRSADNNLPRGVACDACHGRQHPRPASEPANCSMCHTRAEGSRVTQTLQTGRPNLHFSHQKHAARGATCEGCHGDMSKVRLATTLQLPSEATCLKCHDGQKISDRCSVCHPSDAQGRLVIRDFADRTAPMLVPRGAASHGAAHDLGFVEDHRGIAKSNPSLCASCHNESFCADCHAGPIRPLRIHAGDYLTTHALDARAATQDCQSCHRLQTDCLACHERVGFGSGPDRQTGPGSSLQFHPAGFGWTARRAAGTPSRPSATSRAVRAATMKTPASRATRPPGSPSRGWVSAPTAPASRPRLAVRRWPLATIASASSATSPGIPGTSACSQSTAPRAIVR
ncbi:MAG: cytochrome c3 family protein [Nannocystaceae bacterium]